MQTYKVRIKILFLLLCCCAALAVFFFPKKEESPQVKYEPTGFTEKIPLSDHVTLIVQSATLDAGLFSLTNNGNNSIFYGDSNFIEAMIDNTWCTVTYIPEKAVADIAYHLEPGESANYTVNWNGINAGFYRFIVPIYMTNDPSSSIMYAVTTFEVK